MISKIDDREKLIRDRSHRAVNLAMECRWEEAAAVNEELLDLTPNDVEASNRLGRAYLEMGDCARARLAFERTLQYAPRNTIAQKNLDRLAGIASSQGENAPASPTLRPRSAGHVPLSLSPNTAGFLSVAQSAAQALFRHFRVIFSLKF